MLRSTDWSTDGAGTSNAFGLGKTAAEQKNVEENFLRQNETNLFKNSWFSSKFWQFNWKFSISIWIFLSKFQNFRFRYLPIIMDMATARIRITASKPRITAGAWRRSGKRMKSSWRKIYRNDKNQFKIHDFRSNFVQNRL